MADGSGHFAQGGQFARLLQRLFGHGKGFLNALALRDFTLQRLIERAQLRRFPLENC